MLLADVHAHLDDAAVPFEILEQRVAYYKAVFAELLAPFKAPTKQLTVRHGPQIHPAKLP